MAQEHWFDALSKTLRHSATRRTALRAASGLVAGLVLGGESIAGDANAKSKKKSKNGQGNKAKQRKKGKPSKKNPSNKDRTPGNEQPAPPAAEADPCNGACGNNLTCCDGQCVYIPTDQDHCGRCGHFCQGASVCIQGACACDDGWPNSRLRECPGLGCVDTDTDSQNCGRCGNVCAASQVCRNGQCSCLPGWRRCGATCVDTDNDPANCGGCGNGCISGEVCRDGHCVCDGGGCSQLCMDRDCPQGQICVSSQGYLCNGQTSSDCRCGCGPTFQYCLHPQTGWVCASPGASFC